MPHGRLLRKTSVENKELIYAMLQDADRRAYDRGIPAAGGFLSMDEQSAYYKQEKDFLSHEHFLDGGHENADRAAAFFLPEYFDRSEIISQTIAIIRVLPLNVKFTEELSHRDYLGALMNLGIERDTIGDILTGEKSCIIFALRTISEVILRELTRVKHTSVSCELIERDEVDLSTRLEELSVNVASERIDAVIAAVYRISRQQAVQLIAADMVSISARQSVNAAKSLKEGDRVSVRGLGKFIYEGISGSSRRGRLYVDIKRFV